MAAFDHLVLIIVMALIQLQQLWHTPGLTSQQQLRDGGMMACFMIDTQNDDYLVTFVREHAIRILVGWSILTTWIVAVNPVSGIAFAPLFAHLWPGLSNYSPNKADQFCDRIDDAQRIPDAWGAVRLPGRHHDQCKHHLDRVDAAAGRGRAHDHSHGHVSRRPPGRSWHGRTHCRGLAPQPESWSALCSQLFALLRRWEMGQLLPALTAHVGSAALTTQIQLPLHKALLA